MSTRKYPAPRAVPQRIYQLHVSLVDIQPTVWRRLWVADTLTLARLDRVIQAAMGWTNSHLHEFVIAGRRYGIPDEEWPEAVPTLDELRFDVGTVLGGEVGEFTYTYDFGDGWQHAVKVEQAMFPNDLNIRPVCPGRAERLPAGRRWRCRRIHRVPQCNPRPHARSARRHVAMVRRPIRSNRIRCQCGQPCASQATHSVCGMLTSPDFCGAPPLRLADQR